MKKAILILLLAPALVFAQKPVKPNLNKVLNFWKEGTLKEAKEMIDLAETDPKLSLDGKTFYYKGLVYAALDTTANEEYKALASDPLTTAMAAFEKADGMSKGKEYFVTDQSGLPALKSQQMLILANFYLNQGATLYQEEDYEAAIKDFLKTQTVVPNDTNAYFYGGYAYYQLEKYEDAINQFKTYLDKGGKSPDAYSLIINTYSVQLENKEEALKWTGMAKAKYPNNSDFPKVEIGLMIDLDKIADAKKGLEMLRK